MKGYISRLPHADALPGAPRKLAILGSTGSIGRSALAVARAHPGEFSLAALTGGRNVALLAEQAAAFRPGLLAVLGPDQARELAALLPGGYAPEIVHGPEGFVQAAATDEADVVLSAIVGAAGLAPTLAAVEAGKIVALANKESLVLAGGLIRETCARTGAVILPVDSEHNALFQALEGHKGRYLDHLVLTASGGPFRTWPAEKLAGVTAAQALKHPNWSMGAKITIDSATLMNKGLEVIEACHLYGLPQEKVRVLVHPQSIVHSLAAYRDGSFLAHLGQPDMRIAIAYCLCYPKRLPLDLDPLDLAGLAALTFETPRADDFPCLDLARRAQAAGQGHCVVLNAANEVAVDRFLRGAIAFCDIPRVVDRALTAYRGDLVPDLPAILELDQATRREVAAYLSGAS